MLDYITYNSYDINAFFYKRTPSKFTEFEFNILKDFLKLHYPINLHCNHDKTPFYINISFLQKIIGYYITLHIRSYDDEYFYIESIFRNPTNNKECTKYLICDQFDGMMSCLSSFPYGGFNGFND